MSIAFTIAGAVLQLFVLGIAGYSIYRTRVERAPGLRGVAGSAADLVTGAWRFITNKPQPVKSGTSTGSAELRLEAASWAMRGPPAKDAAAEEHVQYVERELVRLHSEVGHLVRDVEAEKRRASVEARLLGDALHGRVVALREEIDSAVTDKLAAQALGLWVAALGAVLTIIVVATGG